LKRFETFEKEFNLNTIWFWPPTSQHTHTRTHAHTWCTHMWCSRCTNMAFIYHVTHAHTVSNSTFFW